MATVVRVKRHLNEDPSETLLLNCKRRKVDEECSSTSTDLSTVLKFVGTVKDQNEDIFAHLKKPSKSDLEQHYKKHNLDLSSKLRAEKQQDSKNSRYKVVNCFRSQNSNTDDDKTEEDTNRELTVYDLETAQQTSTETTSTRNDYVYDLYYTTSDDLGDAELTEQIRFITITILITAVYNWRFYSVYPLSDELVYGSMRDNGFEEEENNGGESEDSNSESNWRNDYPDESDMESVNADDMIDAMDRVDLNNELSSDDGEEGFVYSIDSEAAGFEEDIDDSDVQRYGERYARFKARHRGDLADDDQDDDLYYNDSDSCSDYY